MTKFKEDIMNAAKNHHNDKMDLSITDFAALIAKEVLSQDYFKGVYTHLKLCQNKDNNIFLGHKELNKFKNHTNQNHSGTLILLNEEENVDSSHLYNEKEYMIENFLFSGAERSLLKEFKEVVKASNDIMDIVNYVNEVPSRIYELNHSLKKESDFHAKSLFEILKSNSINGEDAIDNKNIYKQELYGNTGWLSNKKKFSLDTFFIRDNFFYGLNNLMSTPQNEIKKKITEVGKERNNVSSNEFLTLLYRNKTSIANYDKKNDSTENRTKHLEKHQKNKILSENSLLSILLEFPSEEREQKVYNQLFLKEEKQDLLNRIDKILETPSVDDIKNTVGDTLEKAVFEVCSLYPSLSSKEEAPIVFKEYKQNKGEDNELDLLELLINENVCKVYDFPEDELGSVGISFEIENFSYHKKNYDRVFFYAQNDIDVVAASTLSKVHAESVDQYYMGMTNVAWHHKDNEGLKNNLLEKIVNHAKEKEGIAVMCFNEEESESFYHIASRMQRERDDAFILLERTFDDIYAIGIGSIVRFNEEKASQTGNKDVSYKDLLNQKKKYTEWFLKNIDDSQELSDFVEKQKVREKIVDKVEEIVNDKSATPKKKRGLK